nr:GDSL-type esterase/lipase family protein [Actinomycetospora corticicola]
MEPTERGLRPHRLPAWARAQNVEPQLAMAESQPSGVRLAVRTAASAVELDTHRTVYSYRGLPPRPEGVYDLVVDGAPIASASTTGGTGVEMDPRTGEVVTTTGPAGTVRFELPPGEHDVEIWLPTHETTDLVAVRADAPLHPASGAGRRRWVHHGSSISHGSNAASPTGTWAAVAARTAGVELTNLGFGGSAMVDPFVARTIRDLPADVISVKLGINVVNGDVMRRRAFVPAVHGFLDTIREGHPTTPLLLVSPILCPIHEDTPGPGTMLLDDGRTRFAATGDPADVPAGRLTLRVIRELLAAVVAQRADDPHLAYLDGRELYGEADEPGLPLPDALHPDAATHRSMGERFARLFADGGPLAG